MISGRDRAGSTVCLQKTTEEGGYKISHPAQAEKIAVNGLYYRKCLHIGTILCWITAQ